MYIYIYNIYIYIYIYILCILTSLLLHSIIAISETIHNNKLCIVKYLYSIFINILYIIDNNKFINLKLLN